MKRGEEERYSVRKFRHKRSQPLKHSPCSALASIGGASSACRSPPGLRLHCRVRRPAPRAPPLHGSGNRYARMPGTCPRRGTCCDQTWRARRDIAAWESPPQQRNTPSSGSAHLGRHHPLRWCSALQCSQRTKYLQPHKCAAAPRMPLA